MSEKIPFPAKIQLILQSKHGKSIVIGGLAITMTVSMLGIAYVASKISDRQPDEYRNESYEAPRKNAQPDLEVPTKQAARVDDRYGDLNSEFSARTDTKDCDNRFPDNGFKRVFRKDWAAITSEKSEFTIDNKTGAPIWLRLTHPTAGFPVWGIMVHPWQSVTERINIGLYGIEFTRGLKWCNQTVGITDAKTMGLAKNMPLNKNNSMLLRITSDNAGQLDAVLVPMPRIEVDPDSGLTMVKPKS